MRLAFTIGLGLFLWWTVWICSPASKILFPSPFEVFRVLVEWGLSADFFEHLFATVLHTLAGLSIGTGIGIPLGLVLGFHEPIFKSTAPVIDFLRSIPAVTLFPLISLVTGIGAASTIWVTGVGVSILTVFYLASAVHERPRALEENVRDLGATKCFIIVKVLLPQVRSNLLYAIKQGFGLALVVTLVGEMFLGSEKGLGQLLIFSHMSYRLAATYAVLLCIGCLGSTGTFLIDRLVGKVLLKLHHE